MNSLERLYLQILRERRATAHHAPKLRDLASRSSVAVEFGVRSGLSAIALLAGGADVYSYDLTRYEKFERRYQEIERASVGRWHFTVASTLDVKIPECDLLFIDDLHNYDHVKAELALHAGKVRRWIAFHDTVSCGEVGQATYAGEPPPGHGERTERGIMPAIDEFLAAGGWRVESHDTESFGLMVIERATGSCN